MAVLYLPMAVLYLPMAVLYPGADVEVPASQVLQLPHCARAAIPTTNVSQHRRRCLQHHGACACAELPMRPSSMCTPPRLVIARLGWFAEYSGTTCGDSSDLSARNPLVRLDVRACLDVSGLATFRVRSCTPLLVQIL